MRGICPECKKLQPVGEDDRMLDHPDCEGVGQESGIILFGKKIKSKSRDSKFDHEMGDEDEHSPDSTCGSVPLEKDFTPNEVKPLLPSKSSIFGSIGAKIMENSGLSIFHPGARKLSQKERKARK